MYYKAARIAIVAYEARDALDGGASYRRAQELVKELKETERNDLIIALVGTKADEAPSHSQRQSISDEAQAYATFNGILFVETSAKDGTAVKELFVTLVTTLLECVEQELGSLQPYLQPSIGGFDTHSLLSEMQSRSPLRKSYQAMTADASVVVGLDESMKRRSSSLSVLSTASSTSVPPAWVEDRLAKNCSHCSTAFTVFVRKHHCRNCGKIVCSHCSSKRTVITKFHYNKPVRVCSKCYTTLGPQPSTSSGRLSGEGSSSTTLAPPSSSNTKRLSGGSSSSTSRISGSEIK